MDLARSSAQPSTAQKTAVNQYWVAILPSREPQDVQCARASEASGGGHRGAHAGRGHAPPLQKAAPLGSHSAHRGPGRGRRSPGNGTRRLKALQSPGELRSQCAQTLAAKWEQVWD